MGLMLIFPLVLLIVFVYLGLRLATVWYLWPVFFTLTFGIMTFLVRKVFRYQVYFSYACMGIITYLVVFTLLRDIALITGIDAGKSFIYLSSSVVLIYGVINASSGPKVKKVFVPVENLHPSLRDFRIAQISDLHIGPTIRQKYVTEVVKRTNNEAPDLIVMTGDIGDGPVKLYREDVTPLSKLRSKYGTFFVPGNHEYYWNANEWLSVMNNIGAINLVNRAKVIHHQDASVLVAGIPDPVSRLSYDLHALQDSESAEKAHFRILLSHRPAVIHEASLKGFHLVLAGHTHAGQFFPWTIVVKFIHKISKGLHRVNSAWIYVNQGTGSWGPLLRVGTNPEITLLILKESTAFSQVPFRRA